MLRNLLSPLDGHLGTWGWVCVGLTICPCCPALPCPLVPCLPRHMSRPDCQTARARRRQHRAQPLPALPAGWNAWCCSKNSVPSDGSQSQPATHWHGTLLRPFGPVYAFSLSIFFTFFFSFFVSEWWLWHAWRTGTKQVMMIVMHNVMCVYGCVNEHMMAWMLCDCLVRIYFWMTFIQRNVLFLYISYCFCTTWHWSATFVKRMFWVMETCSVWPWCPMGHFWCGLAWPDPLTLWEIGFIKWTSNSVLVFLQSCILSPCHSAFCSFYPQIEPHPPKTSTIIFLLECPCQSASSYINPPESMIWGHASHNLTFL